MSTKAADEPNPNSSAGKPGEDENEGGLMPAILAGVGILAVVALLVFWPTSDKDGKEGSDKQGQAANGANGAAGAGGKDGKAGAIRGGGGVAARSADDPDRSGAGGTVRRNSRLPALEGMGLAPGVPAEEPPPKFDNVEQEITWYEAKLERANANLETRTQAKARLVKLKASAGQAPDADAQLARIEGREKLVNDNFDTATAKVAEIEAKLAELRGE